MAGNMGASDTSIVAGSFGSSSTSVGASSALAESTKSGLTGLGDRWGVVGIRSADSLRVVLLPVGVAVGKVWGSGATLGFRGGGNRNLERVAVEGVLPAAPRGEEVALGGGPFKARRGFGVGSVLLAGVGNRKARLVAGVVVAVALGASEVGVGCCCCEFDLNGVLGLGGTIRWATCGDGGGVDRANGGLPAATGGPPNTSSTAAAPPPVVVSLP